MEARPLRAKDTNDEAAPDANAMAREHGSAVERTLDRRTWSLFLKASLLVTIIWAISALGLVLCRGRRYRRCNGGRGAFTARLL